MVTFYILSEYSSDLPAEGANRKIAGGPLYDLPRIYAQARKAGGVRFWTRRSELQAIEMNVDTQDVAQWLLELKPHDYCDSEWCSDGRGWAACDAYVLQRKEWIAAARKYIPVEYFLKFALAKSGALVLMVSCHTSS
jgi:hypothetical protein